MKVHYRVVLGAVIIAAAVTFFKYLIGGNTIALLNPQGMVASTQRNLIVASVLIMLIVVVPMFIILFTFSWKYRATNPDAKSDDADHGHAPRKEASVGKQLLLWAIPTAIIIPLSILAWGNAHAVDPYQPITSSQPSLTIQVIALPWKWLFIYPAQNIATVNFIEFPVATPVHFELTADAPMSSFWIPQLGSQIYAMDAMETQLNLIASSTGEFVGKDTEINGAGYAGMKFMAKSVSHNDFDAWVASVKGMSGTLNQDSYNTLAQPSENNPPHYFASVDGDIFDGTMIKFMAPSGTLPLPTETGHGH